MTAHDISLVFYSFMASFIGWPALYGLYRLFNPWQCKCGKRHWSATKMLEHVEMKHVHE